MGLFGGSDKSAEAARLAEEKRQENIKLALTNIDRAFSGFDDKFYADRAQAYQNFALPQLAMQSRDTNRSLAYKMANQRMLDSSAARFLGDRLGMETNRQRQGIVDTSLQQANDLRRNVAQEKGVLYSQALASADPAAAQASALSTASSLQLPSTFAPVSNFLQGWANTYLADKVVQAYKTPPPATNSFVRTPTTLNY